MVRTLPPVANDEADNRHDEQRHGGQTLQARTEAKGKTEQAATAK